MCFRVRGLVHILSTPSWALKRRTVLKIKNSGMQWLLEFWEGRGYPQFWKIIFTSISVLLTRRRFDFLFGTEMHSKTLSKVSMV